MSEMDVNGGGDSPEERQRKAIVALEARSRALLAKQLWLSGLFADAETELAQAIALTPNDAWTIRQAIMMPSVPESRRQIDALRARSTARLEALLNRDLHVQDPVREIDWTSYLLAYHGEHGNERLHRLFHRVCSRATPSLDWQAPHIGRPRTPGRPRVGFVSWFLGDHTIARLFTGLIERLDADAFDVHAFAVAGSDGYLRQADLRGKRLIALPTTLDAARRTIADAELDVLIYLDIGMDPFTLFLAHARLAATQAVLWGHPDTTGLPTIDVFLSCDAMEPDDGDEHYSERLIRLPGPGCWFRRPEVPDTLPDAKDYGLPEHGLLYLCPQTPQKFHPDFDPVIRRVLCEEPTAHLVLTAGGSEAQMRHVRQRIVAPLPELASRIHIQGSLERPRFIGLMRLADVMLDPPHYSGGHTTLEAFACGTPVVTWPGRHMRARHTFGFYRLLGIEECVVPDLDRYADVALALGRDGARRTLLRNRIKAASPILYEDEMVVRAFEAFLWSVTGVS